MCNPCSVMWLPVHAAVHMCVPCPVHSLPWVLFLQDGVEGWSL